MKYDLAMKCALLAALLSLPALTACAQNQTPDRAPNRTVTINGDALPEPLLATLEALHGVTIESGAYWYDAATGAWGLDGEPTGGFILPGLALGGPLRADASRGQTGVYVNGRNLPAEDLAAFESVAGEIPPGRYWLDQHTNVGLEGGPAVANLASLAQQGAGAEAQNGDTSGPHRNGYTGTGSNSSGGSGYVMGSDWSVSW